MKNTQTTVFMRSLYENTESNSCVCVQSDQSVFDLFY